MAGGTGGHIFPALAIANELKKRSVNVEWLGSTIGMEKNIIPKHLIRLHRVTAVGLRGKNIVKLIKAPFMLSLAMLQTFKVFLTVKPDLVIGMGGYVSGIGGIVAWLFRVPLIIHEQNAIPGTTNLILSKIANQTLQAFDNTFDAKTKAVSCGNPIHFKVIDKSPTNKPLNLLILGGSLGAKSINEAIPFLQTDLNIWHQTGERHYEHVKSLYAKSNSRTNEPLIEPFIDDMAQAYAWSDIVICRSGAMTVSELIATNSIGILVPFPYAIDDHQTANAKILTEQGAAILLPEEELSSNKLDKVIGKIKIKDITSCIKLINDIDSATLITDYILMPNLSNSS